MEPLKAEATLVLDSLIVSIAQVEQLIDIQSQMFNIDDVVYGKYMLSVVEGMSNAIIHGNKLSNDKKVTYRYSITPERIEVSITDEGPGFDPALLPDPTAEENLDRDCGRGIFLMRHLSDTLTFTNGGRTVNMMFLRPAGKLQAEVNNND